jgi:hypothetical protein
VFKRVLLVSCVICLFLPLVVGAKKDANAPGGCASQAKKDDYRKRQEQQNAENRYHWSQTSLAKGDAEADNVDDRIKQIMDEVPAETLDGYRQKRAMDMARLTDTTKSMVKVHSAFKSGNEEVDALRKSNIDLAHQREASEAAEAQAKVDAENTLRKWKIEQNRDRDKGLDRLVWLGLIGLPMCFGLWSYAGKVARGVAIGLGVMIVGAIIAKAAAPALEKGAIISAYGASIVGVVWLVKVVLFEKKATVEGAATVDVLRNVIRRHAPHADKALFGSNGIIATEVQSESTKKLFDRARQQIAPQDIPDPPPAPGDPPPPAEDAVVPPDDG